jgi:hypothetical protein
MRNDEDDDEDLDGEDDLLSPYLKRVGGAARGRTTGPRRHLHPQGLFLRSRTPRAPRLSLLLLRGRVLVGSAGEAAADGAAAVCVRADVAGVAACRGACRTNTKCFGKQGLGWTREATDDLRQDGDGSAPRHWPSAQADETRFEGKKTVSPRISSAAAGCGATPLACRQSHKRTEKTLGD